MSTFPYLFGVLLGECILKHTDNLSKTFQSPALTAAETHHVANLTCQLLRESKMMNPMIYSGKKLSNYLQRDLDVDDPVLPRMRKTPRRHEIGSGEGDFHSSPKEYFKVHYYEALASSLLIKAAHSEEFTAEFDSVIQFHGYDLDQSSIEVQTDLLHTICEHSSVSLTFLDIKNNILSLSPGVQSSMSEVCKLLKLILVMPATNARGGTAGPAGPVWPDQFLAG